MAQASVASGWRLTAVPAYGVLDGAGRVENEACEWTAGI